MYHEELKLKFFKDIKWAKNTIPKRQQYFSLIGKTEDRYHKDVAEMTVDELICAIKETHRVSGLELCDSTYGLKQYISWYDKTIKDSLTKQREEIINNFDPLDYAEELIDFGPCYTFDQIESMISKVYSRTDGFLIWPAFVLAWIGLSVSEIIDLKEENFTWYNKQIKIGGEVFQFNRAIYDILKIYASTTTGWRKQNRVFQVKLVDVGYFLKPTVTQNSKKIPSQVTKKQIAAAFDRFNALYQEQENDAAFLSHQFVWRMGAFDRLSQLDSQTEGGIANATPKTISATYRTTANNRTKKLILAEYQIYKKKVAEVVK